MRRRFSLAPVALVLLLAATSLPAHADSPKAATAPLLTLDQPQPDGPTDVATFVVVARLIDAGGEPIGGTRVEFMVEVDFPGASPLLFATKTTDATGRARVRYRPAWNGEHRLIGRAALTGVTVTDVVTFAVGEVVPNHVEQPRNLRPLEIHLAWVVPAAVVVLWAVLAFITVNTVLGIARPRGDG
ncbi:MAG: hypothetical protein V3S31_04750 [Dehalococcoidia bacterium]